MLASLENSLIRIFSDSKGIVGMGFLALNSVALTCAHVVADALDLTNVPDEKPEQTIQIDFPLITNKAEFTARVIAWQPPDLIGGGGDIAVIEILGDLPSEAQPIPVIKVDELWEHKFRTFGCPQGYDEGVWSSGLIRSRQAAGWLQIEGAEITAYAVRPGFSGSPVWDDEEGGCVGIVVAADTTAGIKAAYALPTKLLIQAWPALETTSRQACPYKGLFTFREQDAALFYGRDTVGEQLFEMVQHKPLVALVGSSGSGKSSVVFARLLPRLHANPVWRTVDFRPGKKPLETLAASLLPLLEPDLTEREILGEARNWVADWQAQRLTLADFISRLIPKIAPARRLLLVIDQFEELYSLCQDKAEQKCFIDLLLEVGKLYSEVTIVLTLRADFMSQALAYRPFADALQDADLKLGPMTSSELEQAIEQPALQRYVHFEPGLVQRILEDIRGRPGDLPLLEFALSKLWEQQQGQLLTHAGYEAIGQLEGALACYADQVFEDMNAADQEQAHRIFIQLVQPGTGTEDTRRLAYQIEFDEPRWQLIHRLATKRLIVVSSTSELVGAAEIIHEALIQHWGKLRRWLEVDRDFRAWQERLRMAQHQWQVSHQDEGALLRGVTLAEAEEWMENRLHDLSDFEIAFIRKSQALRDRELEEQELGRQREIEQAQKLAEEQRLRAETQERAAASLRFRNRLITVIGTAAIIIAVIAAYLGIKANKNAAIADARALAAQGQLVFEDQPLLGLRLELESLKRMPHSEIEARNSILKTAQEFAHQGRLVKLGDDIDDIYPISDKINLFQRSSTFDELRLTSTGELVATLSGKVTNKIFSPDPDAAYVFVSYANESDESQSGELRLTSTGELVVVLSGKVNDVIFSPDLNAAYFVVRYSYSNQPGELRRTSDGAIVATLGPDISKVIFSLDPNAAYFVVSYFGGKPGELRRTSDGAVIAILSGPVEDAYFSPDPNALYYLVFYFDQSGELRRTSDGAVVATLSDTDADASFSPNPNAVNFVVRYANQPGELRRTSDGALVATLSGVVRSVKFSPDPNAALFVVRYSGQPDELRRSSDGVVIANPTEFGDVVTFLGDSVTFSPGPNAAYFVVHSAGQPDELRRTSDGSLISTLGLHNGRIIFSPDPNAAYFVRYTDEHSELRRTSDGSLITTLGLFIGNVSFSPDPNAAYLFVSFSNRYGESQSGELRRTSDGKVIATPSGFLGNAVIFSTDPNATYYVVGYSGQPGELRRTSDGSLVATLAGPLSDSKFSKFFETNSMFLLNKYANGKSDLWQISDHYEVLIEFGLALENYIFYEKNSRLITRYLDGRAYLLDLDWVRKMGSNFKQLSSEELEKICFEGPFATGLLNEAEVQKYLVGNP